MTKTMTALCAAAALSFVALPAAADMQLLLDDDVNMWVEAPAPSGINLTLDDDTRIISRVPRSAPTMSAGTVGGCSQIETSLGMQGAECGVTPKSTLVRDLIDLHD